MFKRSHVETKSDVLQIALVFSVLSIVFFTCKTAQVQSSEPHTATPYLENNYLGAVAADQEQASQAGVDVLKKGGNAVDAAVATALALGVVNPNSSGMGGGGFAVVYDAKKDQTFVYDFREVAPALLTPDKFVVDGKVDPKLSKAGGLAVGVPGEVAGLEMMWQRHGKNEWKSIVLDIATLAEDFIISKFVASVIEHAAPTFPDGKALKTWAVPNGATLKEGQHASRPNLIKTLKEIAHKGSKGFYEGWVADDLVQSNQTSGGVLTHDDLRSFKVIERKPLLGKFSNLEFKTMPMPSSGGILLLEMLGILEAGQFPIATWGHRSAKSLHLLSEVLKHGFADRARMLGDTKESHKLSAQLLEPTRLKQLANTITLDKVLPHEDYGDKNLAKPQAWVDDKGTSHFCVIDSEGNAVALTTTVNGYFGSDIMGSKSGVVLNNQIDDFALEAGVPNMFGLIQSEANLVGPGKKPLSSMTPTLIFKEGKVVGCFGGSGGPRIISNTFQAILNAFVFGLDANQAVSSPRIHHQWLPNAIVHEEAMAVETKKELAKTGHELILSTTPTAVQGILIKDNKPDAASDPRKGGQAKIATKK